MPQSKKDLLVRAAGRLFYENGYHDTGIEAILDVAGVAKPTLYRYFRSKEALFVAALSLSASEAIAWLREEVTARGQTPREQLLAIFDAYLELCQLDRFQGCRFVKAMFEFPDINHPVHQVAAEYKQWCADLMCELAAAAGVAEARRLANRLVPLLEGLLVSAHTGGRRDAARGAREAATIILDDAVS